MDGGGTQIGRVVCVLNVTAQKTLELQLRQYAWHDPLTGLPNRRLLFDRLQVALLAVRRTHRSVGLLFLDLDSFKSINDHHGHVVGDQVLCQVAQRVAGCLRASDTLARLSGDEFVVLLPESTGLGQADATATRILRSMGSPFHLDGFSLPLTVSIGVAIAHGGRPRDILHAADTAMYQAKIGGPGRIVTAAEPI
jgi:diguanylate cyclase (GGDEF)-like protein